MDCLTQKCIKPPLTFRGLNVNNTYQHKRKHLEIQLAVPAATGWRKEPVAGGRGWPLNFSVTPHPPDTACLSLGGNISSYFVFPGPWHGEERQVDYDWLVVLGNCLLWQLRLQGPWGTVNYELMNRIKMVFSGYLFKVGDTTHSEKDCKGVFSLPICLLPPLLAFHSHLHLNEASVILHRHQWPEMQISVTTTAWIPWLWVIWYFG